MSVDLAAATAFVATHGRVLDRRRLHHALGHDDANGVLAALDAYRNPDGGYGWALESDLRSTESQPAAAMHAFEIFAELAPVTTHRARELCDWLTANSRAGGGLPFALPYDETAGCAPWWKDPDTTTPSLHITTAVATHAHRTARHDPAVAPHPWLIDTTRWCFERIAALDEPNSHELLFSVKFLDAASDQHPDALDLIDRLAPHLPSGGIVPVDGGIAGEVFHPLDFAPEPDRPVRRLFDDDVIAADLDRLAGEQLDDGGWTVNFNSASPAGSLEWRAYATIDAVTVLRTHGRARDAALES